MIILKDFRDLVLHEIEAVFKRGTKDEYRCVIEITDNKTVDEVAHIMLDDRPFERIDWYGIINGTREWLGYTSGDDLLGLA